MTQLPDQNSAPRRADFFFYLIARFAYFASYEMLAVGVGWQIYEMTGRPLDLGLIGLAQFLPLISLSLFTGHAADRYDRRQIGLVCQLGLSICLGFLFWFSHTDSITPFWIYLFMFGVGVGRAFLRPADEAYLTHLVSAARFGKAVAWKSTIWQFARVVGPAVGGMIYAWANGAASVYAVAGIIGLIGVLSRFGIRVRTGRMERAPLSKETLLAGIRYVLEKKVILGAISLDLFAVLVGSIPALLPILAKDVLQVGPTGLGILRAAPAAGAVVMGALLAFYPMRRQIGRKLFVSVGIFGLTIVIFGLSRSFWFSTLCMFLMGASDLVSVIVRQILVQLETPPAMRGRVSAVNHVFISASNELGEFESGVTATLFGLVPAILLGGVATCFITGLWARLFPDLRKLDQIHGITVEERPPEAAKGSED